MDVFDIQTQEPAIYPVSKCHTHGYFGALREMFDYTPITWRNHNIIVFVKSRNYAQTKHKTRNKDFFCKLIKA